MVSESPDHPQRDRRTALRRGKRKRANGEGSIWLRKDGRYGYAAYVLTTAGTYKRVQGYARSHDEARKRLTELVRRADQGVPVASVNWTVAEYLAYWLGQVVREDRRPKTYQGYEGVVRLHLIPGLGSKRLGKLTAQDVRTFITGPGRSASAVSTGWDAQRAHPRCCALGRCCDSRLSPGWSSRSMQCYGTRWSPEVREEIIPRNVASLVQVPAPRYKINRGLTANRPGLPSAAATITGWRPCTSWPSSSACGAASCSACAGRMSTWTTKARSHPHPPAGRRCTAPRPAQDEDSARTVPLPRSARRPTELTKRQCGRAGRHVARLGGPRTRLLVPARYSDRAGQPAAELEHNPRRSRARAPGFHDLRHTCVTLLLDLGAPPHVVKGSSVTRTSRSR